MQLHAAIIGVSDCTKSVASYRRVCECQRQDNSLSSFQIPAMLIRAWASLVYADKDAEANTVELMNKLAYGKVTSMEGGTTKIQGKSGLLNRRSISWAVLSVRCGRLFSQAHDSLGHREDKLAFSRKAPACPPHECRWLFSQKGNTFSVEGNCQEYTDHLERIIGLQG